MSMKATRAIAVLVTVTICAAGVNSLAASECMNLFPIPKVGTWVPSFTFDVPAQCSTGPTTCVQNYCVCLGGTSSLLLTTGQRSCANVANNISFELMTDCTLKRVTCTANTALNNSQSETATCAAWANVLPVLTGNASSVIPVLNVTARLSDYPDRYAKLLRDSYIPNVNSTMFSLMDTGMSALRSNGSTALYNSVMAYVTSMTNSIASQAKTTLGLSRRAKAAGLIDNILLAKLNDYLNGVNVSLSGAIAILRSRMSAEIDKISNISLAALQDQITTEINNINAQLRDNISLAVRGNPAGIVSYVVAKSDALVAQVKPEVNTTRILETLSNISKTYDLSRVLNFNIATAQTTVQNEITRLTGLGLDAAKSSTLVTSLQSSVTDSAKQLNALMTTATEPYWDAVRNVTKAQIVDAMYNVSSEIKRLLKESNLTSWTDTVSSFAKSSTGPAQTLVDAVVNATDVKYIDGIRLMTNETLSIVACVDMTCNFVSAMTNLTLNTTDLVRVCNFSRWFPKALAPPTTSPPVSSSAAPSTTATPSTTTPCNSYFFRSNCTPHTTKVRTTAPGQGPTTTAPNVVATGAPGTVEVVIQVVQLKVSGNQWADLLHSNFTAVQQNAIATLAASLGIDPSKIKIFGLKNGSLIIDFQVVDDTQDMTTVTTKASQSNLTSMQAFYQRTTGSNESLTATATVATITVVVATTAVPTVAQASKSQCDAACIAIAVLGTILCFAITVAVIVFVKRNTATSSESRDTVPSGTGALPKPFHCYVTEEEHPTIDPKVEVETCTAA